MYNPGPRRRATGGDIIGESRHQSLSIIPDLRPLRSKPYRGLNCYLNSPRYNSRGPGHKPARALAAPAAHTISGDLKRRYEQYMLLARESAQAGDRIEAENLYQHAEHYYRMAAAQKAGRG